MHEKIKRLLHKYSEKFWIWVYFKIKPYIDESITTAITSGIRVWGDRNRVKISYFLFNKILLHISH